MKLFYENKNVGVSQRIDKNGQPCLLDPRYPTTFLDEGCPFLSRFSPRELEYLRIVKIKMLRQHFIHGGIS